MNQWTVVLGGLFIAATVFAVRLALQRRDLRRRQESLESENGDLRSELEELREERRELRAAQRKLNLEREALQVSEAKYSTVFRNSPDAVAIATFPEGRILEINDGFVRLTGWEVEKAVGRSSLDLEIWQHEEDRQGMLDELNANGEVRNRPIRVSRRDGTERHCMLSAELIELAGLKRLLSVTRDITKLQEAERDRESLLLRLRAKNAELEQFTYTVSHDLKSPLFTISGFLKMLLADAREGKLERMEEDAERISKAIRRMEELLEGLLELSRAGESVGEMEELDLAELATEAEAQLAREIKERGVEVTIHSEMPRVFGDRLRIFQVFQNLLSNAVKFLGDQEKPRIEIGAEPFRDDLILCRVADNGRGIAEEDLAGVFGLFSRAGDVESVSGTGVGLALVSKIVQAHGGDIGVESEGLGKGSTFLFTLPATPVPGSSSSPGMSLPLGLGIQGGIG